MIFNETSTQQASAFLLRQNSRYYGGQNQSGKLLANYLKFKQEKKNIQCVKDVKETLLTND